MPDDLTVVESKPLPDLSVVSSQPLPQSKPTLGEGMAHASFFRNLSEQLGKAADWAEGKASKSDIQNLTSIANGGKGNPVEAYSPRAGYDLLARATRLLSGATSPKAVLTSAGVALANTNPVTAVPVDAALIAHGGYGVAQNAPKALEGDPEAVQNALLSGSEMAGGAAGAGANLRPAGAALSGARTAARDALFTPEGKPTPLAKALSHPVDAATDYALRQAVGAPDAPAPLQAAPGRPIPKYTPYGQFLEQRRLETEAAMKSAAAESKPVPITQSPNYDPAAYKAGRAGLSPEEAAATKAAKEGTGITVVPEPRGNFSGEVPGYMASVPRGTLEGLALAAKPGAAIQMQQLGTPIIYQPRGAGFSGVRQSIPMSRLMEAPEIPRGQEITLRPNASGESGASLEAINRAASERAVGAKRVRIDTRSGNEIPLIGADAVDAKPGPYDQIVMRDKNGNETVLDSGVKALPRRPKKTS